MSTFTLILFLIGIVVGIVSLVWLLVSYITHKNCKKVLKIVGGSVALMIFAVVLNVASPSTPVATATQNDTATTQTATADTGGLTDSDKQLLKENYKDFDANQRTQFAEVEEKYNKMSDGDKQLVKLDFERLSKERDVQVAQWKEEDAKKAIADAEAKAKRPVTGTATDLGTGTFQGGKDVKVGLYEVTSASGMGNFTVKASDGTLNVNEVLGKSDGMGVAQVRVSIADGDVIQLQGINKVHFQPVTSSFVTVVQAVSMHSGDWVVGEDIVAGRYKATATSGSGNFVIYSGGMPSTNEILGGDTGVKEVSVNLNDGDIIKIAGIDEATLTPAQ